jgi:hypothetical protein
MTEPTGVTRQPAGVTGPGPRPRPSSAAAAEAKAVAMARDTASAVSRMPASGAGRNVDLLGPENGTAEVRHVTAPAMLPSCGASSSGRATFETRAAGQRARG